MVNKIIICISLRRFSFQTIGGNNDNIYLIPTLSFRKLCVSLDTDFKSLDDMVFAELGMTGEEVLTSLREAAPERLCEKYMLKGFIL